MAATEAKYFNVVLHWRSASNKVSPFVAVRIECLLAKNKDDAAARALQYFALAGNMMKVHAVSEL